MVLNYMLAYQIGERVSSMFDKNIKVSLLWDLYPEMFKEEKEINDIKTKKAEMELYKAKFTAFAHNINSN